jgi:predicted TPR repeat methyltransferase
MSSEEVLRDAMAAHDAGRLTAAEVGYRRVLRKRPADPKALYGLAVLSFGAGAKEQGIDYLLRSLVSEPDSALAWNWLGIMYADTGRLVEGKGAFTRATELSPELSEARCNLAICLKTEGDLEGAAEQLRRALECPAPQYRAYEGLVQVLRDQGRAQEAAQTVLEWAAREPANPIARHMAAALAAQDPPSRASDEYVRAYFDGFADTFDSALRVLHYRAPELVANALRDAASAARSTSSTSDKAPPDGAPIFAAILDAGCGTGLCGPLVRELCRTLVGVDLSARMLHLAKQRGFYDELVNAELGAFMRSRPKAFDAIVCADTLVYFGALGEPLAAAHEALRAGGPLVFTVEALPQSDPADHKLGAPGRYAHSEAYLRRVIGESGFMVESIAQNVLRQEYGVDVPGYLVVARSG